MIERPGVSKRYSVRETSSLEARVIEQGLAGQGHIQQYAWKAL